MKRILFAVVILFVVVTSCTKEDTCIIELNKPFTLTYNQTACSETEQFAVKFDSLVTDCRCPANAICIWAGYAQIKLSFIQNNTSIPFYLSTLNLKTDTVIGGYKFHVNAIDPCPGNFSKPEKKEDYIANITVTK